MGFFSKLFNKNSQAVKGSADDFMSLVQVYFQSVMAINHGITNVRAIPEVANFKRLFNIATQKGRLGVGEKAAAKKMLKEDYDMSNSFFDEIENSIKKACKKPQDVQTYGFLFQGFTQDLMMLVGNLMQWKIRVPSSFRKTIYSMTQKTIHDICNKPIWKKDDVHRAAMNVQNYRERLGYSEEWMTEFVFHLLLLAKKDNKKRKKENNKD